nr:cellulose binding domain-containing protein [Streptomyces sp. 142MFCol3.1]
MSPVPALDRSALALAVADPRDHAATWTATPLPERIALLERMLPPIAAGAPEAVADVARAKQIANAWDTTVSSAAGAVTASGLAYNSRIPAGGRQTFGFQGTYDGSFAKPGQFSLNGSACTAK